MANSSQKGHLSLFETMGISVAIMAPTAAMALNTSLTASVAGTAVPLTFLIAMVTIGLVSYAFIQFNRHFSSSGSVYAFTGAALGPKMGFLSGWTLLLTYFAFTGASAAEVGAFLQSFLSIFGINISWIPLAVISALLIWVFAFLDVRIGARVMLIFEAISMSLILILTAVILGHGGKAHHLTAIPFTLHGSPMSSIGLASVFAFLSFAGFEGASSLGEETRNPKRAIPLAIASAVFITGLFYVLVSYAQTVGFGVDKAGLTAFSGSSAPLSDLATKFMSSGFAAAIMFGAAMSAFSSALGTATTGSRLLFSMGRDGFIHKSLGAIHGRFRSPHVALAVVMIVGIVEMLILYKQPGTNVFGWLGSIGVIALLLAYLATNIGGLVFFAKKRVWRGAKLIVPVVAIAALLYTLYSNVYPVPTGVAKYFPYVVTAWVVVGLVVILTNPSLVNSIAKRFATETDMDVEQSA